LPNTLLGLCLALPDLVRLGSARAVSGVIEVEGPWLRLLLRRAVLLKGGARAITFGHVVLAVDCEALEATRAHERVHVAQYERWGPLFIPAYVASSLVAWLRGGNPYLDNRFEREAFHKCDDRGASSIFQDQDAGHTILNMPRISEFYGIVIEMFWSDHNPPHFHAKYGEYRAEIDIRALEALKGLLPPKAMSLVVEWAEIHRDELLTQWNRARNHESLEKIDPLL
jgi:hypothetical protein